MDNVITYMRKKIKVIVYCPKTQAMFSVILGILGEII